MIIEELDYLVHIGDRPWSDYTESDYSVEQWHAACLIHQHEGEPTDKNQCKLPVKTPDGALSRDGVHAASNVLADAKGGIQGSVEEAILLLRYFGQLDEKPPLSLMKHADFGAMTLEAAVEHHGIKGMRWGRRKAQLRTVDSGTPKGRSKKKSVLNGGVSKKSLIRGTAIGLGAYAATVAGFAFLSSPRTQGLMFQKADLIREHKAAKQANAGRVFVENFINANSRLASPFIPPTRLMLNRGS